MDLSGGSGRLSALSGALLLGGCQTFSSIQYVKIAPGPDLSYAQAQCNILASGTQQGFIAIGSPAYVAGASIGNAIANDMRKNQFMKDCMTMQGYQTLLVKADGTIVKGQVQ